jgi:predicted Na+-dependent transporter
VLLGRAAYNLHIQSNHHTTASNKKTSSNPNKTMLWATIVTNILLFLLVMGLASIVDIRDMRKQLTNWKGICIGLFCQFFLLPFFGYLMILIFSLPIPVGIPLLIVVSSPGGSYSNWWCSIMNADLGLSVSMTTVSTFLGCGFLPLNIFVYYSYAAYRSDVLYAIKRSLYHLLLLSWRLLWGSFVRIRLIHLDDIRLRIFWEM